MSKGWRTMTASEATELTLVAQRTAIDEPQTVAAATEYPPWIGVDLDGTIAEAMHPFVPYTIGPPILAMVEKIKEAIADGYLVKVFTARLGGNEDRDKLQRLIRAYTKKHIGIALESTNEKDPGLIAIWDDKAREVEKNTGEFLDKPQQVLGASFKEITGLKKMPIKVAAFLKRAALRDAMAKCAACICGGCIEHDKLAAEGYSEEGFWSGEDNAASGILPICTTTGRIGLAWRASDVHMGDCFGTVGGAVKKGMTQQESAEAELKEETGYGGSVTMHSAFVFQSGEFRYFNFLGTVGSEFSLSPSEKHEWETENLDWFTLDEIYQMMATSPDEFHPGLIALFKSDGKKIEQLVGKS